MVNDVLMMEARLKDYISANITVIESKINSFTTAVQNNQTKTEKSTMSLEKGYKALVAAVGVLMGLKLTKWFSDAIVSAAELGATVDDVRQRTGVSAKVLQEYAYAGRFAGLTMQSMEPKVKKLNERMYEAATSGGIARGAFSTLGVSVLGANGELKNTGDVFNDVILKLSSYENGAKKTALATEIFGRAGTQLIPMLNHGKEKLEGYFAEANKFSLVFSEEMIQRSKKFSDNLTRVKAAFEGLKASLVADAIGDLSMALEWVLTNFNNIKFWLLTVAAGFYAVYAAAQTVVTFLINGVVGAVNVGIIAFQSLVLQIKTVIDVMQRTVQAFMAIKDGKFNIFDNFKESFKGFGEEFKTNLAGLEEAVFNFKAGLAVGDSEIAGYWKKFGDMLVNAQKAQLGIRDMPDLQGMTDQGGGSLDPDLIRLKALEDYIAAKKNEINAVMLSIEANKTQESQLLQLVEAYDLYKQAQINNIQNADQRELALLDQKYVQLKRKYSTNEKALTLIAAAETEERIGLQRRLQDATFQNYTQMATIITSNMQNIAQKTKANATVQKRLAQGQVLIDGAVATMGAWKSAMQLAYPANIIAGVIMSGIITAATMVNAAKIEGQSFARGTDSAPGGVARVGEQGAEDVILPAGARVLTNRETMEREKSGQTMQFNFYGNTDSTTVENIESILVEAERTGRLDRFKRVVMR